jgi:hypothetical protein
MRSTNPPVVATWFLRQLGSGPNNDALLGDLIEQYGQRRSRIWYWRQVFVAIAVSFCGEVGAHKLLALRAIATGWAVIFAYRLLFRSSAMALSIELSVLHLHEHGFIYGAISYLYWYLIYTPVLAAAGWLVARLHREHQAAMVLTFAASKVLSFAPHFLSFSMHAAVNPGYLIYVSDEIWGAVTTTMMILLGGIWRVSSITVKDQTESGSLRGSGAV